MQKIKRNHWVPQSYLKAFAADADKREKIWRFGKAGGDPELKPIEKVAVKFYLYVPQDADGQRDYAFEKRLSSLENWFGEATWHKVCHGYVPLESEPIQKMMSLLAAVMCMRNPLQFERSKAMHRQIVEAYKALPAIPETFEHQGKTYRLDTASWPAYRDASEDDMKRHWLSTIGSIGWLAEAFMTMRWSIVFSEEPVFITTDNPVVVMHDSLEFRGLRDAGARVYFPLSPTRLLVMDNMHNEPSGQYYPLKVGVGNFNSVLWDNALEYMFAHRHTDLVCREIEREAESMGC